MKRLTIAALIAGQVLTAAQPALAAELAETRTHQMGAFGGVRLRVPLDDHAGRQPVRAGLTLAPTMHGRTPDGASRMRIGEGLELGFTENRPLTLSLAGTPVNRLGAAQDQPESDEDEDEGGGPSTLGWIAIGVGAVAIAFVGLGALCLSEEICDLSE